MQSKKILSGLLSAVIFTSALPVFAANDNFTENTKPLIEITFDENGTKSGSFAATIGGTVKEHGTVDYVTTENGTKALSLTRNAGNYLELPDGILAEKEAATISFWLKPGSNDNNWAFMTTPITNGSQPSGNKEQYLGVFTKTNSITAERYNNSGKRLSNITASGDYTEWRHIAITYETNGTKIYVDGKLEISDTAAVDIKSLMTSDAKTWIGHANWGEGEGFSGTIDDFKLYGTALEENEIKELSKGKLNGDAPLIDTTPVNIKKSVGGNPVIKTDGSGNMIYSGDPAAVVIDDTVYLIVGHDVAKAGGGYNMPDWLYYTSKDMVNWSYGGVLLNQADVPWRKYRNDAWTSQMIPYTNKETGQTQYYFYFCTRHNENYDNGYIQYSIGVAVADKPEGPYTPLDVPLVDGGITVGGRPHSYEDIDPTVWIDTDENGMEHRYLMWGNGSCYMCELNEDMTSVKDMNNDGEITMGDKQPDGTFTGDIKYVQCENEISGQPFTEAPWLYRRQDEKGNYYGKYYMFGAWGWSEKMAYATADDPWGTWTFQSVIMENTLTSGTNHPSVIDFNGKTYFIYHCGALPGGTGGSRSVCIRELEWNSDGTIGLMEETSAGLGGFTSTIQTNDGKYLGHDNFKNPQDSGEGIYKIDIKAFDTAMNTDTAWEIVSARSVPDGADADNYVSIQSENRTGYFIKSSVSAYSGEVETKIASDNVGTMGAKMSYKTVKALDGSEKISFESVAYPGQFLCFADGTLKTVAPDESDYASCSFNILHNTADDHKASITNETVNKENITFNLNNADGQTVTVYIAEYDNGTLVQAACENNMSITSNSQTITVPFIKTDNKNDTVIFVWDGMKPVTDKKSIE